MGSIGFSWCYVFMSKVVCVSVRVFCSFLNFIVESVFILLVLGD